MKRFEEIEAWQFARELSHQIYEATKHEGFMRDYGLKDQIQRAAVSIMSNIAEGFERNGNKEFINFLTIAKGSCGEVRSQLYVALDQGYIDEVEFKTLVQTCVRISVMLQAFIITLRVSPYKGTRYKSLETSDAVTMEP
jgi:four helix bundle protein